MSDTDRCARCGGDCPMTRCPECGGCENTGPGRIYGQCPACQPAASDREMPPCDICESGGEDCGACEGSGDADYDGDGRCWSCGGTGWAVPEHCCLCGGSSYCTCCRTCGQCVGTCRCPLTVQLHDGSTLILDGATGEDR
jgi:hypothetical protein